MLAASDVATPIHYESSVVHCRLISSSVGTSDRSDEATSSMNSSLLCAFFKGVEGIDKRIHVKKPLLFRLLHLDLLRQYAMYITYPGMETALPTGPIRKFASFLNSVGSSCITLGATPSSASKAPLTLYNMH